jgi:N-acetylglutamate synthase-like GNAT family acetyltransferase
MTLHLPEQIHASTPRSQSWKLHILYATDWQELQDTRLHALEESPHAFVATYAEEALLPESYWRSRIDSSTWTVAREGGQTIGLVRLITPADEPLDVRGIESVWVSPVRRYQGVVRSMMEELELRALDAGVARLRLWVLDTNESAEDAYVKLGYNVELPECIQPTRKLTGNGMPVHERRMVKDIL